MMHTHKPPVVRVHQTVEHLFANSTQHPTASINNRLYITESEGEADQFDQYWNEKPAAMQDGNGCRAMVIAIAITLFFAAFFLMLFVSCAPKVAHRPRYNHWAQPYQMYAPVKQHNPHKK